MFTNYQTLDLENGTIEYVRSGKGKTLLFAHGLLVNANLWYETVKRLQGNYDCVVLNLPFGAHRLPMPATADLSPPGLASMVSESISRLHLKDVTLISNDSGDVLAQLLATSHPEQVARLVMTNGDAFENFLPIRYRYMQILSRLPGSLWLANRALHWRAMQRLPLTFGPTSKRPIPPQHIDDYLRYARASKGVRRDLQMVLQGISTRYTLEAAKKLHTFTKPVTLIWAREDRVFPLSHAYRLAELFPHATVTEIADSYAFVPEDQPALLATKIREFVG